MDKLYIT